MHGLDVAIHGAPPARLDPAELVASAIRATHHGGVVKLRASRALLNAQFTLLQALPKELSIPAHAGLRPLGSLSGGRGSGAFDARTPAGPGLEFQDAKEHPSDQFSCLIPVLGAGGDEMSHTQGGFLFLGHIFENLGRVEFVPQTQVAGVLVL